MNSEYTFILVMTRLKIASGANNDGQLAEKLGISASSYANLKKRRSIPCEKVIALAISLNVNIHWVFTGESGSPVVDPPVTSSTQTDGPFTEKILAMLPGLTERQLKQLEEALEDYHVLNRLIKDVETLQQVNGNTPG